MSYEVVYAPLAIEDLDAIWEYLGVDCENEAAATKTVDAIMNRIDTLSSFPESGTPLDARCIIHSSHRFVVSGHYLAFYRTGNGRVYVDRILDGRTDYLRHPFGLDDSAIDLYIQQDD